MRWGQTALRRLGGSGGLGCAGITASVRGDDFILGNDFKLPLQCLDLLLERDDAPQVGHGKIRKRLHLERMPADWW